VGGSKVVDLPVGRAQGILLHDPAGVLERPTPSASRGSVDLDVGVPEQDGEAVRVPLRLRSAGGGPLEELAADLVVVAAEAGTRIDVRGTYRWGATSDGYGLGVLAHRMARWLVDDLVDRAGARLLELSLADG
jgi:hypothetical protein